MVLHWISHRLMKHSSLQRVLSPSGLDCGIMDEVCGWPGHSGHISPAAAIFRPSVVECETKRYQSEGWKKRWRKWRWERRWQRRSRKRSLTASQEVWQFPVLVVTWHVIRSLRAPVDAQAGKFTIISALKRRSGFKVMTNSLLKR